MIKTKIMIINSNLVEYTFQDGPRKFNKVTFAFQERANTDYYKGFTVVQTNIDPSSFVLTKEIEPFQLIDAVVTTKATKDGAFKYTLSQIKDITV